MKSILGIAIVLLFGTFCLFQSSTQVGDLITSAEAKNVWAGTCTGEVSGTETVCYAQNSNNMETCSSNGCGCTTKQKWGDTASGGTPDEAKSCGTSACTTPLTFSGSCGN
jgi:hypothetical protein